MSNKPNILLIMADQLAAQALSLYGNRICKTPNLERLAAEGVTFGNNYSNNPLCVPSRASMMTGKPILTRYQQVKISGQDTSLAKLHTIVWHLEDISGSFKENMDIALRFTASCGEFIQI